jgi:bifunctional enzyme CysN/CysC
VFAIGNFVHWNQKLFLMHSPAETAAMPAERTSATDRCSALHLLVCGAADAGKSILIDRLFDNQQARHDRGAAYRNFTTPRRAIAVAEAPGDAQNIRDLVARASDATLALLLVDASTGLLAQTRHHAIIASMSGIRYAMLAVNKMDLVGFDRAAFEEICDSFRAFAGGIGLERIACIPVCAFDGDNVSARSARTPWYAGPHLLKHLQTADVEDYRTAKPFRMSVEAVDASRGFHGFAGTIASGSLKSGEEIAVLPSGKTATVKALLGPDGERGSAQAGDAVTVTLTGEIGVAPGDMFAALRDRPQVADQFAAHLIWMSGDPLLPERSYLMNINNRTLAATITKLKHRIDVDSLAKLAAKTLAFNEIGVCNLSVASPVAFDSHSENRHTGGFILIDRDSNETVAAGMIDFVLRRATNIHHQNITISKAERTALKYHRPAVLWFTGLSGAGKSTIANLVEAALHARGVHTLLLDGDNIRHGLNRDLGFTEVDRVENIRRIGEVAKLMTDAGLIVLCSFISPFRAERRMVRELVGDGEFVEIFVDTPLEECIARDPKGLYKRALAGEIKNFTGVDQPYETPSNAEVRLLAGAKDADRLAQEVIESLGRLKIL